jgi:hypothetical protein
MRYYSGYLEEHPKIISHYHQPFCCKHAVTLTLILSYTKQNEMLLPDCENVIALPIDE